MAAAANRGGHFIEGLRVDLLQVGLTSFLASEAAKERRSRERSRAILNRTKDFFESLGVFDGVLLGDSNMVLFVFQNFTK